MKLRTDTIIDNYTVGFLFSPDMRQVLLIRKKRKPAHHIGKYNGLGGGFEEGETAVDCIVREFMEESGILVSPETLVPLALLSVEGYGEIAAFWATSTSVQVGFEYDTDEGTVRSISVGDLPSYNRTKDLVSNVIWLIQMALDTDHTRLTPTINYSRR